MAFTWFLVYFFGIVMCYIKILHDFLLNQFYFLFRRSLTTTLPVFEYRHSSDDEMLSADDIESTDDSEYQAEDATFETPGMKKAYDIEIKK